jgi:hypothetical protein
MELIDLQCANNSNLGSNTSSKGIFLIFLFLENQNKILKGSDP